MKLIVTVDSDTGAAEARLEPAALANTAEKLQAVGLAVLANTAVQTFMSGLLIVADDRMIRPPGRGL